MFVVCAGIAVFVFWTHRANIARLRNGDEHRFGSATWRRAGRRLAIGAVLVLADSWPRRGSPDAVRRRRGRGVGNRAGGPAGGQRPPRDVIWALEPDVAASINDAHENTTFLPGVRPGPIARRHDRPREALPAPTLVVYATPSHVICGASPIARRRTAGMPILAVATKGIEERTLALMTDVVADETPGERSSPSPVPASRRRSSPISRRRSSPRRRTRRGARRADGAEQRHVSRLHARRRHRRRAGRRAQERHGGRDRHRRRRRARATTRARRSSRADWPR